MKTLGIVTATLAMLSGAAVAADMPMKAYKAAPMAVAYDWSGFYTTSSIGGQWWDINGTYITPPPDRHVTKGSALSLGSGIGYQKQFGSWVVGIEGSYNNSWGDHYSTSLSVSPNCLNLTAVADRSCLSQIRSYWTGGAKVGYAWDKFMVYGTGGYANGRIDTRTLVTSTGVLTSVTRSRQDGWYVGAGIDMFVTKLWLSDLIIGAEYTHVDFGNATQVDVLPGATGVNNRTVNATDDVFRLKATFKYTPGGAVVAKY